MTITSVILCYVLIFTDSGDGSGNNVSITSCMVCKARMFKLINLTEMGVLNVYFRAKKVLFKKLM